MLIIISSCSSGQTQIPVDFIETALPKYGTDEWHTLNYSQNEFGVEIVNGQLRVIKVNEKNKCEFKVPNGKLVGINRGEWGGKLNFIPFDTTQKKIEIKSGNIKYLFTFQDKIYFIEGLAHLSINEGALYELDTTGYNFFCKKILDFEDAPEAYAIYNDKILIASHENFYIVKDFKKELIFKEIFWNSLYPNSIAVIDEKNVFLGVRDGIVRLDLTKKDIIFYKYAK